MVSFLAFPGPGKAARVVLGLRGPGLLAGGFGTGFEAPATGAGTTETAASVLAGDLGLGDTGRGSRATGCSDGSPEFVSFHRGHFFASGELSGTSTTSL